MTPRGLVRQADEKAARARLAADIAELGPPSGWIVVNEQPMAFWLPDGVVLEDLGDNDESDAYRAGCASGQPKRQRNGAGAVSAHGAPTQDDEVPF